MPFEIIALICIFSGAFGDCEVDWSAPNPCDSLPPSAGGNGKHPMIPQEYKIKFNILGFLNDYRECGTYFACYNGTPWCIRCPYGFYFDPAIQMCDAPQNVDCPCPPSGVSAVRK